jgi:hypothetical protein
MDAPIAVLRLAANSLSPSFIEVVPFDVAKPQRRAD